MFFVKHESISVKIRQLNHQILYNQEMFCKYPNEQIRQITNKGMINELWVIGEHTVVKISDDAKRTEYEIEDLKLLSKYINVPIIQEVQPNCIFMQYCKQQKVNWKLL